MKREDLLIEADELAGMLDDPDLRLFDATVVFDPSQGTGLDRYNEGHIPGAVFLDHAALSDRSSPLRFTLPAEAALEAAIGAIGVGNRHKVVVYSSDMIAWATRVWWVLSYAGHEHVRVLNGGLAGWKGDRETEANRYPATDFKASFTRGMFASKEEVLESIRAGSACVVNTLMPEMYVGEADVPYAGHITGSVNHPLFDLMDGHYLLDDETLRRKFANQDFGAKMITYCGGGIAATVNACAAKLAGVPDVAVYDGSMSEWQSEGLPLTTGQEPGSL